MKNTVPPIAATASRPTMITDAIRTEIHVFRVPWLMAQLDGSLEARVRISWHRAPGLVGGERVIIALAERHGGLQFCPRRGPVSRLERQPAELEMRPCMDPFPPLETDRGPEVGFGFRGLADAGAGRPALVVPQGVLPEHPRPPIVGEAREAIGEEAL